jgi:hypothetical protein
MPVSFHTISRVWEKFAANVIPANAPRAQREDMQSAFYAGSLAVLNMIESLADAPSKMIASILLAELHDEVHAFADKRIHEGTTTTKH